VVSIEEDGGSARGKALRKPLFLRDGPAGEERDQPAMIEDNSEDAEFSTETTPLPVTGVCFKSHTLVAAGDRRLLVRPTVGMRIYCLAFITLSVSMMGFTWIMFPPPKPEGWILGGIGLVFLIFGTAILPMTSRLVEFDRDTGIVHFRGLLGLWTDRPLSDVLAVQLVQGSWHSPTGKQGVRPYYLTYQLNLVLADDSKPRVNLTNHSDWDATLETGSRIAEFLGVPLRDEASARTESEEAEYA
jgi:hypothetical protein